MKDRESEEALGERWILSYKPRRLFDQTLTQRHVVHNPRLLTNLRQKTYFCTTAAAKRRIPAMQQNQHVFIDLSSRGLRFEHTNPHRAADCSQDSFCQHQTLPVCCGHVIRRRCRCKSGIWVLLFSFRCRTVITTTV